MYFVSSLFSCLNRFNKNVFGSVRRLSLRCLPARGYTKVDVSTGLVYSRVLRDSTPRFVGPSVRRSVGPSVGPSHFTFLFFFAVFGLTAPARVIK